MNKTCCMCQEELDVKCFKSNKKRKDGLQSQCIECQREYRSQHYLNNRQKYIDKAHVIRQKTITWWKEYKKTLKCSECGEDHPACIDFHHTEDNKEAAVSSLVHSASRERLLKEVAKCEVLCSNCHRKRHWNE